MSTTALRLLALTTLCLSLPLTTLAADPAPAKAEFRSFTSGVSCEQAIKSLDKKEGLSDFALLVSAFVTGTNYVKGRDSHADLKGMMVLTEKYCRDNPNQPVTSALIVLDKMLDRQLAQEKKADATKSAAPTPAAKPAAKPK